MEKMSQWSSKKLVKSKSKVAGLKYLLAEKSKQTKISHIIYSSLEMQEYFVGGYCNTIISKLIFKARSKTLDIKEQKKWKYDVLVAI